MDVDPKELAAVITLLNIGKEQQSLLERAIGQSFLAILSRKKASLVGAYEGLGGQDPLVTLILKSMNEKFNEINVKAGVDELKVVANSDRALDAAKLAAQRLAGSCSAAVSLRDFSDHYTHTLAQFATPDTMKKIASQ